MWCEFNRHHLSEVLRVAGSASPALPCRLDKLVSPGYPVVHLTDRIVMFKPIAARGLFLSAHAQEIARCYPIRIIRLY